MGWDATCNGCLYTFLFTCNHKWVDKKCTTTRTTIINLAQKLTLRMDVIESFIPRILNWPAIFIVNLVSLYGCCCCMDTTAASMKLGLKIIFAERIRHAGPDLSVKRCSPKLRRTVGWACMRWNLSHSSDNIWYTLHRVDVLYFRAKIYILFFHLEKSHKRLIYHHVKVVKGNHKFTVQQWNSLLA